MGAKASSDRYSIAHKKPFWLQIGLGGPNTPAKARAAAKSTACAQPLGAEVTEASFRQEKRLLVQDQSR